MKILSFLLCYACYGLSNSFANTGFYKNYNIQLQKNITSGVIGDFKLVKIEKNILVQWSTITETDNCCFEIERSTDGQIFTNIGKVAAAINSTKQLQYNFTDIGSITGKIYYKLKIIHTNGTVEGAFTTSIFLLQNNNAQF